MQRFLGLILFAIGLAAVANYFGYGTEMTGISLYDASSNSVLAVASCVALFGMLAMVKKKKKKPQRA